MFVFSCSILIFERLFQFLECIICSLVLPLMCPQHTAPQRLQIGLGSLLFCKHLNHNIDTRLRIPESDEFFNVISRHVHIIRMRLDLA
jgi:hypothetical protein